MDLKQGVREAKVTCKKTAFATLGGGRDSPILNPSPVLGLKLVLQVHWGLLCWPLLDGHAVRGLGEDAVLHLLRLGDDGELGGRPSRLVLGKKFFWIWFIYAIRHWGSPLTGNI